MSTPSDIIASETKNCSFTLQSIKKFLSLIATQKQEYSDISYKANGSLSLVLKAKKNGVEEVALKVLECTKNADQQIQTMQREFAICKQLPSSDYLMAVQSQFFLTELNESAEQDEYENSNTAQKVYFVQEMELCQGSLQDTFYQYSQKNRNPPTEEFKELLAIQMLDAVNLLHQKHIAHGNISTQHFFVSFNKDYPVLIKLGNLWFTSPDHIPSLAKNQKDYLEQDLVPLGKIFLQLDSIGIKSDQFTSSNSEFAQPELTTMIETHQFTSNTLLCQIANSFLRESKENGQDVRSMLLLLLQKQTRALKIPLFSVVLKSHLDSLLLPISSKRIRLDYLVWQMSKQHKLHSIDNWFDSNGQRKTELSIDLLKSALEIMLEWKEFSGQYDVLGVGVGGVVFGVENLKEKRKSALKLSLCTNKAEVIREIGIMRICQAPCIVKFYQHKFFKDANGNEFVVYELERCKYSLIHHLELQRITGEYTDEQKNHLAFQIIDSVRILHKKRILHRNIKLDSFLITEDRSGQVDVKLSNFSHTVQLQNNFEIESDLENQLLNRVFVSPVNCILQMHKRESFLYFAPERWENPDLSTYLTDSFSVGLCIYLLDNWLVCSEEQLAQKLLSFDQGCKRFYFNMHPQINIVVGLKRIAKQLLMFQPDQRTTLRNVTENCTVSWKENKEITKQKDENNFQQLMKRLTLEDRKSIDYFKQAPMIFFNLQSISLNLNNILIEDIEVKTVLNLISNLPNLSKISIDYKRSSILLFGAKSLLTPLERQTNLSEVSLSLYDNSLGDIEAKYLLSPFENLHNLLILNLFLEGNQIGDLGAQFLLSPLANLLNLSSLSLNLNNNQIGDLGVQSLLSPLENLQNISSLNLSLNSNKIGDLGAQSLLSSLGNLLNISSLNLSMSWNQIGGLGAQSLLSPLANLLNLSDLNLNLNYNEIGDSGAQSLLSPLSNLLSLSNLNLNLQYNKIGDLGAQSLLSPLANLQNLSSLNLNLLDNKIGDLGVQPLLSPLVNHINISSLNLNLDSNIIGGLGAQSLLSPLANLQNLSSLNLSLLDNKIGDLGAQSLLIPLVNLLKISSLSLSLSRNQIGSFGAQSLLSCLSNLLNLSNLNLNLDSNKIGDLGAQSMLSPLGNHLNLSWLNLSLDSNQIGDLGAQSMLSALANLLNLSNLSINLNYNEIGDLGAKFLLSSLKNLMNLSSLSLSLDSNKIGDLGAQFILCPLANHPNLSNLNLNLFSNKIGDLGAQCLLSPCSNLVSLSYLNLILDSNRIGELGGQTLLSPLTNLLNLSSLNLSLSRNQIGDLGVQALLSSLANIQNLSSLNLSLNSNKIGDLNGSSLLSPLANLLKLSTLILSLSRNQIGDLGAQLLFSPIENFLNLSTVSLNFQGNTIHDMGAYSLFQSLSDLIKLSSLNLQLESNVLTKQVEHLFIHYFSKLKALDVSD